MKPESFTESALDRAVHPLCHRGVLNVASAMAADDDIAGALELLGSVTRSSGPVQSEHLYWCCFGLERGLQSLQQGRNKLRRRRRSRVRGSSAPNPTA